MENNSPSTSFRNKDLAYAYGLKLCPLEIAAEHKGNPRLGSS